MCCFVVLVACVWLMAKEDAKQDDGKPRNSCWSKGRGLFVKNL
jgi:hypothetical protein